MKKYGLIGNPLGHSFSPQIHAHLGDYEYRLYPLETSELEAFVLSGKLDAFNVTIPYKERVMPFLDRISPEAERIGSVNTVLREPDGSLSGYNTDYFGFELMMNMHGVSVRGKKALVLGSGGASKTAQAVLKDMGASSVTVISRSGENNYGNLEKHSDAEIIVNTTPLGMYPKNGAAAVDLEMFPSCSGVADMVYNPEKTALLIQAEKLGIPVAYGLTMLVAQAQRAAELFFGKEYPDGTLSRVISAVSAEMRNIVLVGMPGCGKSTVGKIIADRLGKSFADCDSAVCEKTGLSAARWITEFGEARFRREETAVLAELCKQSGTVIATGGGAVTVPENRGLIRQNSRVFFINRPIELLSSDGRPLSGDVCARRRLFESRAALYRDFCDVEIAVGEADTPEDVADRIIRELERLF